MNRVILMGHLGDRPELRTFPNGDAYITFRMCTDEPYKDAAASEDDRWQTRPEWHNVKFTGRSATNLATMLRKGQQVMVEGKLHTRPYDDAQGAKRFFTEVKARQVVMTSGRRRDDEDGDPELVFGGARSMSIPAAA
ncbi:MAG: single-stranded DNA-binding protein [Myxococcota bacterium]